jgi:hypothetical protein
VTAETPDSASADDLHLGHRGPYDGHRSRLERELAEARQPHLELRNARSVRLVLALQAAVRRLGSRGGVLQPAVNARLQYQPLIATSSAEKLSSQDDYGLELPPGGAHYRAYVGPPQDYDLIAGLSFTLLFALGLREKDLLLDMGCGSLRVGRLLIPYLRAGHYFGIEPNDWLVEEGIRREVGTSQVQLKKPSFRFVDDFSTHEFGIRFNWVLAQSVFSHTYPDLAEAAFRGVAQSLASDGILVATYKEGQSTPGSGWKYPGLTPYRWVDLQSVMTSVGLVAERVPWAHPRQTWFVASLSQDRLDVALTQLNEGAWGITG